MLAGQGEAFWIWMLEACGLSAFNLGQVSSKSKLAGGFKYVYFHPYLGIFFQMGWIHQPEKLYFDCS